MTEALIPCPHFGTCGGCAMQDRSDADVADWKRRQVVSALAEHGIKAEIRQLHTSPPQSRRRAVLSGRRTKKTTQLGFYARRSETLVSIETCLVLHPDIMAALPDLHRVVKVAATRSSVVRISVTVSAKGLDVAVGDARARDASLDLAAPQLARGFARLTWNDEVLIQNAVPIQTMDGIEVVPPPGGFLQATECAQDVMIATVCTALGKVGTVADLFAGSGTFSLPMARFGAVHAVENDAAALASVDAAWRQATGLHLVTTELRDLFRRPFLASELARFDAVVLDPPRAGAAAQIAEIAKSQVSRVVYVSCNPASFARDAAQLISAGFALDFVDAIDQFRWSNHVEIVAGLTRR